MRRNLIVVWMGSLIGAWLVTAPVAAGKASCEATQVTDTGLPSLCSVESMAAAVDARGLALASWTRSQPVPAPDDPAWHGLQSYRTAKPFPGQGRMEVGGLVNAGGAACTQHIQAAQGDSGADSAIMDALPDNLDPNDLPPAARKKIEKAKQKAKAARARIRGRHPGKGRPEQRVLFDLFSPQLGLSELAWVEPNALHTFRAGEGSIAGWPANSSGRITIELPGTSPGDLAEGETYEAVFEGGNPTVYGDKRGRIRYFKREDVDSSVAQLCRKNKGQVGAIWDAYGDVVSAAQQVQCDRKAYFLGRTRRVFAQELTGEVTIERITAEKVVAQFELSGQGHLETNHFRLTRDRDPDGYVQDTPLPDDRELKYVRKEESRKGPVSLSGRLVAPNHTADLSLNPPVSIAGEPDEPLDYATVVVSPESAGEKDASDPPFSIRSHQPQLDKRNVDWERPGIRVTFNKRFDSDTVDSGSVYLAYRSDKGRMERVPVDVQSRGGRQVRLAPRKSLKDGVRYRVTVKGGPQGVRTPDGETLAGGDYTWDFSTTVNLADNEPMPGLMPILDSREGIEPHVFQVSRDAPLVTDKPTLTRVYGKWKPHDEVAPAWQVTRFLADVRVKGAGGGNSYTARPLYREKERVHIARPDQYDASDKQRAANSVNFFGWRPQENQAPGLVAEVEPADQCQRQRVFESDSLALDYTGTSPTLDIDYYFVRAGAWARGSIQRNEWSSAQRIGHRIAARGAAFTTQNFPVVRTRARYRGTITADAGWWRDQVGNTQASGFMNQQATDRYVVDQVKRKLADRGTDADLVLLFMAGDIQNVGGRSYREAGGADPGVIGVFFHRDYSQFLQKAINDVAHETAHVFLKKNGGEHYPRNQSPDVPLEGFRMATGGRNGVNKSVTEGNGNPKGSMVYPLMRAGQDPAIATFVTNENYSHLLSDVQLTRRENRLRGRRMLAARGSQDLPASERRGWSVHGFVRSDGSDGVITGIEPVNGVDGADAEDSPWRAVLSGDDGGDLASAAFEPEPERPWQSGKGDDWRSFSVRVARVADASKLTIEHGGERIASRARSASPPEVAVESIEANDGQTVVQWSASDPDGDELVYDVAYSANGEDYRPVAVRLTETEIAIPTAELNPGADPRIRVGVFDGFDTARASAAVPGTAGMAVLATLPEDGGRMTPGNPITAVLNADPEPGSVTREAVTLRTAEGQAVEAEVRHAPGSRRVHLVPENPLTPGQRYTARIADVSDEHGNALGQAVEWRFTVRPAGASGESGGKPEIEESSARVEDRRDQDPYGEEPESGAADEPSATTKMPGDPDEITVPGKKLDPGELPLNKAKVRYWIRTRIATNRLQDSVKANADEYDRVVPAYFRKRKELLKEAGWTVAGFEATGKRIMRAEGAIRLSREEDRGDYGQEEIEATRDDWSAVKPFLDELKHLTDWVADNVDQPPKLD